MLLATKVRKPLCLEREERPLSTQGVSAVIRKRKTVYQQDVADSETRCGLHLQANPIHPGKRWGGEKWGTRDFSLMSTRATTD